MPPLPLNRCVPRINSITRWERKAKFLLYEDTYPDWALFAIEDGSFYYEIAGEKGTAAFGDLVVCRPGTPFRRVVVTPLTFYMVRFRWEDGAGRALDDTETEAVPSGKLSLRQTSRLHFDYGALLRVKALPEPQRMLHGNHYLQDLWFLYCAETASDAPGKDRTNPTDPRMQEASVYLQQHAFQPVSLKALAAALGMGPVQLTKKFKAAFGVTPIYYLTSLRLDKAKTLLLETKLTIDQISECCGYQNGFYLHRVFVKHERVTPSQYRKTHRV